MRQYVWVLPVTAISLLLSMCGGKTPVVESNEASSGSAAPSKLPLPASRFAVPTSDDSWIPVSVGLEKGADLAAALQSVDRIAVVVPKAHDVRELENRIHQMVKAAAPDTTIVAKSEAALDRLLDDETSIPYRSGASETRETQTYIPKDNPLTNEWHSKKGPLKGVDAVLIVRPVEIDEARAAEMRKPRIGGCDATERTLQEGVDAGRAYFVDYETYASKIIAAEFSKQLRLTVPYWREELKQTESIAAVGSAAARCAASYSTFLDKYDACLKGQCRLAPRVFSSSGGVVGMVDESGSIPDVCPVPGMRDFAADMRNLGDRALLETLPFLDGDWTGEMLRLGALEQIRVGFADVCAPRIRRANDADLAAARQALHDYLVELNESKPAGDWERMRGMERISGVGPVRVLARIKAHPPDPSVAAAAVLRRLRALDACSQGNGRLLQVSLAAPKTSEVLYMDIFFESYLLCGDLPPR